jgi:hypothetical protein
MQLRWAGWQYIADIALICVDIELRNELAKTSKSTSGEAMEH